MAWELTIFFGGKSLKFEKICDDVRYHDISMESEKTNEFNHVTLEKKLFVNRK